ncbi:Phosphoadenosine phosphosulfate reductase family protein [Calidithermus terrae]|uniref:Phosphoadenosine phosphosulfate reductase family protein n=1 Tax=Calidithermus terrae TaxID=1408545 RepID=A0A399F382_9DEIN|nr:phosphoadenosine phosphosulfate reductase family protein [Calidithermus terrae]RIH90245.1 Phosphoadenosine phosphosulfate reductase family protein [Calidithermus terrae]
MSQSKVRHVCLISGGKDSTALAVYLRQTRPGLEMEYVFCDTHKELDETYEYLARIEGFLGKEVIRLSAGLGERGFDHHLDMFRGYLPSPSMRWCTRKLKIEPFERYIGDDPVYLYVGIRADENREGYISTKPNIIPVFPFKDDGVVKEDVFRILEESGIGLPKYYEWRSRSGCYFCFYQRKIEWVGLLERHPDLFEKAKAYEKVEQGYTWVQGESLEELSRPERVAQIKAEEAKRRERAEKRRRPRTLAEAFTGSYSDEDEVQGCLVCQL